MTIGAVHCESAGGRVTAVERNGSLGRSLRGYRAVELLDQKSYSSLSLRSCRPRHSFSYHKAEQCMDASKDSTGEDWGASSLKCLPVVWHYVSFAERLLQRYHLGTTETHNFEPCQSDVLVSRYAQFA